MGEMEVEGNAGYKLCNQGKFVRKNFKSAQLWIDPWFCLLSTTNVFIIFYQWRALCFSRLKDKDQTHLKSTPLMTCQALGACCCCCCCWGSWAFPAVCTVWPSVGAAVPLLLTYNQEYTHQHTIKCQMTFVSQQFISHYFQTSLVQWSK